jgi:uncharacterized membrane protein YdjX (TVP38/TMEM64 family)
MQSKNVARLSFITTSAIIIILIFWFPANQDKIVAFALAHTILAPLIIILWRTLGIVIPPIPGGILSFLLIPIYGWFWSYIFGFLGVIIGASIAFWIARHFREPIVSHVVPLQELHIWEKRISKKKEFFGFLGIRLTTAPIMDFISYVAGLSTMSFKTFIVATCLADLPIIVVYYFSDITFQYFVKKSSSFGFLYLILLPLLYFIMEHYEVFKKKNK